MFRLDTSHHKDLAKVLGILADTRKAFSWEGLASALEVGDDEFNHFAHSVFWLEAIALIRNELDDLAQGPDRKWEEGAEEYNRGKQASFVITREGLRALDRAKWEEKQQKNRQIEEEIKREMGCKICKYYVWDKDSLPKDHLKCPINHESAVNLQVCEHLEESGFFKKEVPPPFGLIFNKLIEDE